MTRRHIFTIGAAAPFAEHLAQGLLARVADQPFSLADCVIYLPTRRAARSFGDVFAKVMGGAALLPQMRTLGDSDDDDLLDVDIALPPAIAPLRRRVLLARLIREWDSAGRDGTLSFAQAAGLAASLARVMDEVETQGCDLARLADILPADMAEHWQGVTRFLDVLRLQWPAILAAEGAINPAHRRNQALAALAARLEASPPPGFVIAAGSTGSIPATARLLKSIAQLPHGAVVLPGLDRALDAQSWDELDPGHPQYGLRQLLRGLEIERDAVEDWSVAANETPREALLRETLRPAPATDAWRALVAAGGGQAAEGLGGLALAQCADAAQEALTIALALRHSLETPQRHAALVTPDRNLARRVAAEMTRWGVTIDDSAGRPLAHAAAGSFLCLLAEAAESHFSPVPLLALLKHPFARHGQDGAAFRAHARELDRWCLRGPRPDAGLKAITAAIARAGTNPRHAPPAAALARLSAWWEEIAQILAPLEKIFAQPGAPLEAILDAHVMAAEALACDESENCILWRNDDGMAAYELVAQLRLAAAEQPPVEPGSYPAFFRAVALEMPVRAPFGRHPRLSILGPLEARLQRFDLTILGGLNEGVWPAGAGADPWFSRPIRDALGLEQPERGIGQAAHDFAMLAAGPQVLMTRALKADGAPTIASRWLQRLEQLVLGLKQGSPALAEKLSRALAPERDYADDAAQLATVPPGPRLKRPAPRPPVAARPRKLSVTEIETWLRDPYAIYARHVLGLRPLAALNEPIGPLERGNGLHKAMEKFIEQHGGKLPDDAAQQLALIADRVFQEAGIPKAALAVWRPRFFGAAQGLIEVERERQDSIASSRLEIRGTMTLNGPGGDFILSGIADRIDILKTGKAAILDYKSGNIPSRDQVDALLAPQLPLEAAMLAQDGFGIGQRIAEDLIYLSLADGKRARKPLMIADAPALAIAAAEKLAARIAFYDQEDTPYYSRVQPLYRDSEGDYDHLARVREWSSPEGGE